MIAVAVVLSAAIAQAATVIQAEKAAIRTEGGQIAGGVWNLWSNGRVGEYLRITKPGTYRITVRGYGSPAAGVWPQMALMLDGLTLATLDVNRREPADYRFSAELPAGTHEIAVGFLNDHVAGNEDRNLYLDYFTIEPPPGVADPAPVEKAYARLAEALRDRIAQLKKNELN